MAHLLLSSHTPSDVITTPDSTQLRAGTNNLVDSPMNPFSTGTYDTFQQQGTGPSAYHVNELASRHGTPTGREHFQAHSRSASTTSNQSFGQQHTIPSPLELHMGSIDPWTPPAGRSSNEADLLSTLVSQQNQFYREMRNIMDVTSRISQQVGALADVSAATQDPKEPSWYRPSLKDARAAPPVAIGTPILAALQKQYPSINQWTMKQHQTAKKKLGEDKDSTGHVHSKRGLYNLANDINTAAFYCERFDGTIMGGVELNDTRQTVYSLSQDLLYWGRARADFAAHGQDIEDAFIYELERRHPALALCVNHYKAKLLIAEYYRVWVTKHLNSSSSSGSDDAAAPSAKRTRKRKPTAGPSEELPSNRPRISTDVMTSSDLYTMPPESNLSTAPLASDLHTIPPPNLHTDMTAPPSDRRTTPLSSDRRTTPLSFDPLPTTSTSLTDLPIPFVDVEQSAEPSQTLDNALQHINSSNVLEDRDPTASAQNTPTPDVPEEQVDPAPQPLPRRLAELPVAQVENIFAGIAMPQPRTTARPYVPPPSTSTDAVLDTTTVSNTDTSQPTGLRSNTQPKRADALMVPHKTHRTPRNLFAVSWVRDVRGTRSAFDERWKVLSADKSDSIYVSYDRLSAQLKADKGLNLPTAEEIDQYLLSLAS